MGWRAPVLWVRERVSLRRVWWLWMSRQTGALGKIILGLFVLAPFGHFALFVGTLSLAVF